ncbi:MAG: site-specific integrase [Dactylosporangium sp.]|nr:site-specific integrase [Dactylosporangium sp.]
MSRPSTFKRCGCRDPRTGRRLGNTCPRLRRYNGTGSWSADHGTWHYRLELPATVDGARRQLRRGGFAPAPRRRPNETTSDPCSGSQAATRPRPARSPTW